MHLEKIGILGDFLCTYYDISRLALFLEFLSCQTFLNEAGVGHNRDNSFLESYLIFLTLNESRNKSSATLISDVHVLLYDV